MHVKSSDWYRHNHHLDPNYENVILHVVWEQDVEVAYPNGKNIPTLQLRDFVEREALDRHERLFRSLHKNFLVNRKFIGFQISSGSIGWNAYMWNE